MVRTKIKDIMTKKVVSVSPETPFRQAAFIMAKNRFHGIPVIDDNGILAGIITEIDFFTKDVANIYLPSFSEILEKTKIIRTLSYKQKKDVDKLLKAKAKDIMTGECLFIFSDADIKEGAKIIINKQVFTLPVVDRKNKVVGIVTATDIIAYLYAIVYK